VGRHLIEYLTAAKDVTGVGVDRQAQEQCSSGWTTLAVDLLDQMRVEEAVSVANPDVIFHLADPAVGSRASDSGLQPYAAAYAIWYNLLEATRKLCPEAKVLFASSSAVYGRVKPSELPIREDVPVRPLSHQGVAKASQELLGGYFEACFGVRVIRLRTFNLIGPDQGEGFVCSAITKQLVEIKLGLRELLIEIGNLSSSRDYVDVRDAVEAYWALAEKGTHGEAYNVCSGRACSVQEVLDILLKGPGSPERVAVKPKPDLQRRCDIPISQGSYDKLRRSTGWSPRRSLERSLEDLMTSWECALSGRA